MAAYFCWKRSSLLTPINVIEFQAEAYSSLNLIYIKYNTYVYARSSDKKVTFTPRTRPNNIISSQNIYIVDMVVELTIRINKYT